MDTCIKKSFIVIVFIFLMVSFPVTGFSSEPVRLGVAVVKTGELSSYGISGLRGVELAVRDINLRGGILNRQVELFVEDDLCLPKKALIVASKLLTHNVHAVIGHICSGATFAALGTYKNADIITISPSATNPDLTQSGDYPNFYRTISSDDTQALVQIEFVVNQLKLKRIAVIHDKSVYGKGLAIYAKEILEKIDKRKLVLFEGVSSGSINYTQFVQKVKKARADAVIYGGYHPGASKIVRQMRLKKIEAVFISGDGIKDKSFIASSGKNAEGVYATAPKDTSTNKMAVKAIKAHRAKYDEEPGPFFLNAWAAVLALANAIETAGVLDYDKVSKALKSESVKTPIGNIGFDERGDATGTGFSVFQVQNGVFIELK